ncbi:MAG: SurA N-terminal domain-containing protein [Elusimicrobiaceae bacterium]|nr:SurA N-terminal domain-containing protein [Elusimicrobiaceae bacterium]
MISFFIKYRNPILITTVIIFLVSIGILGAGVFADQYSANAVLAKVGNAKVKYRVFATAYDMARQQYINEGKEITEEQDKQLKQEIVQSLIMQEALSQVAEDFDIGTSKTEVAYLIKNNPAFAPNGEFNKNAYIYVVRNQFHVNPAEFENNLKKQISVRKFQNILALSALPTSFEKNIIIKGSDLKDEEKQLLEEYVARLKVGSFMSAFSDALNTKYKTTMGDMQI